MTSILTAVLAALRWFRRGVDLAGIAAVLALALVSVLQFPHPPAWDSAAWVRPVRAAAEPPVAATASALSVRWPPMTPAARFLPFLLVAVVLAVRAILHGLTDAASARVRTALVARPRQRVKVVPRVPPPAQPPAVLPLAAFASVPAHESAPAAAPPPAAPRSAESALRTPAAAPDMPPPLAARPLASLGEPVALSTFLSEPASGTERSTLEDLATLEGRAPTLQGAARTAGGPPASEKRRLPARIGRYQIVSELGRGAMGVVYKGLDPHIGRTVAIKSILTNSLGDDGGSAYKQRFQREAQVCGKLSHPSIVAIHDLTEDETGQPCLVMEFVEGSTLESMVRQERLPLGQVVDIVTQVAGALDYAHAQGVIHRDVKPANILVTPAGRAKLGDFGIAKIEGVKLTQTGQIVGTPAFMSPEQFMAAPVDSRSDLFSLGAILYWLCTGEKPFPGETITAIAYKVVQTAPVPARQLNPALPDEIDVILARCLAKSPEKRYATGADLVADLEAFKTGRPVRATMAS